MSDLSLLSGENRNLDFRAVRAAFDPQAALAVSNRNARFCPYPSTYLNRYDAVRWLGGRTCVGASS